MEIARGTTPEITFTFNSIDPTEIAVAWFTVSQDGELLVERDLTTATVGDNYISWKLTQEETLAMNPKTDIKLQCRYRLNDGGAYLTRSCITRPIDIDKDGEI